MRPGAGNRRHRILFRRITESSGTYAGSVETPAKDFTAKAEFQPMGSRQFPAERRTHSEATARFSIMYRRDIDHAAHEIVFRDQTWEILGDPINVDGKDRELLIEVRKVS